MSRGGFAILLKNSLLYITVRHGQHWLHWRINNIQVPRDIWFHLGVIWNYESGLHIYINGNKVAEKGPVTYTATSANDADGIYMQLAKPNTNPDNSVRGAFYIDEWYFLESALISEYISYMYQSYNKCKIN